MEMKETSWKKRAKDVLLSLPLKNVFIATRKVVKMVGVPNKRFYWHLRFRGNFNVPIDETHSFRLRSTGSSIENSIFWAGITGEWEATSVKLWMKLAADAEVIFDVGANNGIYALVAKAVNSKTKVYAFEPVDRIYERLVINNQLNNFDIVCLQRGVSNENGTATFYDIQDENSYSSSLNTDFAQGGGEVVPVTIKTVRLDTFIKENDLKQVDLIKIDVETYEPQVLEGLGEYLEKFKPTLLIEILNDEVGLKVEDLVGNKNYLYFDVNDDDGSVKRVERITRNSSFNYLLCTEAVARRINIYQDSY